MSGAAIRVAFREQAEACRSLGSPFTADLCLGLAQRLDRSTAFGRRVLDWRGGDVGPSGDSVPLRSCGALHALVLSGDDADLAATYPPHGTRADLDVVMAAVRAHDARLTAFLASPPQTNETARAGAMLPVLATIAAQTGRPLRLLEIGTSAGLNLRMDRFDYDLGGAVHAGGGGVAIVPEWRGAPAPPLDVAIASRAGCDLAPIDPTDPSQALRLRAYCWPDQAARRARLDAAIALAARVPAELVTRDGVAFLRERLEHLPEGVCTTVFSTIAWQYLPARARAEGEAVIEAAGARATADAPLAWARMEADGHGPGAGLTLRVWPHGGGALQAMGRADFHGRWADWKG